MFPILGSTNSQRIIEGAEALEIKLDLQDWFVMLKLIIGKDVP
jgi:predicted oxidoreductase